MPLDCRYAAWTLTHGHRINHLTILQNVLGLAGEGAGDLQGLNALLAGQGLTFHGAGGADGLTQGSRDRHLEQSSTIADTVPHTFGCGTAAEVPCAFLSSLATFLSPLGLTPSHHPLQVLVAEERRAEVSALTELAKNANWPVELRAMVELATERYETARQLKRRLRSLDDTTEKELAMANKLVSVGRWMRIKDQVGQFQATTGWLQRKKSEA